MTRITRTLAVTALAGLTLTGCTAPGWEGTATVTELELLEAEIEGGTLDHDGVDITVQTDRNTEASVTLEDCPPDALDIGDKVTLTDVETKCRSTVGYSQDD